MNFEVRPNSISEHNQDRMFSAKVSVDVNIRYSGSIEQIDKFVIVTAIDEAEARDIIYQKFNRETGDIKYTITKCDIEEALTRDR